MKLFIYAGFLSLITFSCTPKQNTGIPIADPAIETAMADNQSGDVKNIELVNINGYFTTRKVADTEIILLNNGNFDTYFHPASTMSDMPTLVDFDSQKVGSIILPETRNNVTISLDSSYLTGRTLNIVYSVLRESEERSFSIIPVKLFAFDAELGADSVAFHNGDTTVKYLLK